MSGWFLLGLAMLLAERGALSLFIGYLTKTGRLERRTVIVGGGPLRINCLRSSRIKRNRTCAFAESSTTAPMSVLLTWSGAFQSSGRSTTFSNSQDACGWIL